MASLEKFRVSYYLSASIEVGEYAWAKPGVGTSVTFDTIPDEAQLRSTTQFVTSQILEPVLDEVIEKVKERVHSLSQQRG